MSSALRPGHTFEEAILPHLDAAYNLARWLVRDPAAAEDVVQDTCLRALQYFGSFRGENARAWLLQITRNTSYAVLKAKQNRNEVALGGGIDDNPEGGLGMDVPDPNPGPEAVLVQQQELAHLEAALTALPVHLRECLVLCELEQLSYRPSDREAVRFGHLTATGSRTAGPRFGCSERYAGDLDDPGNPG